MNDDGTDQTKLASDGYKPAWSPDGTKIAFSSYRDGDSKIYVMNADGSQETNLTNKHYTSLSRYRDDHYPALDSSPSWSPDGTKIAFSGGRLRFTAGRYGDVDIWVINADGSSPTRLTRYWVESRSGWWFTLFLILPSLALILLAVLVWRFVRHRH
jgi:Tol biopolymer transport system component